MSCGKTETPKVVVKTAKEPGEVTAKKGHQN